MFKKLQKFLKIINGHPSSFKHRTFTKKTKNPLNETSDISLKSKHIITQVSSKEICFMHKTNNIKKNLE